MESPTHYPINQNLIEKWEKLQNLLKFEVTLMNLSKTHINTSIETISKNVSEYYRKKIQTKYRYQILTRFVPSDTITADFYKASDRIEKDVSIFVETNPNNLR